MKRQAGAGNDRVSIRTIQPADVRAIGALHDEFEAYLRSIDPKRPKDAPGRFRQRLRQDGFGRRAAFKGFVAVQDAETLGYVLYHAGYDPDEMLGRVAYVIDLYVTERFRKCGIGRRLMEKVAEVSRRNGGIDVYFAVWTRNPGAEAFYRKIGASHNAELRFYHLKRADMVGTQAGNRARKRL